MKQKLKRNKGITLIALILTIIVLLILAVVAINAVKGDGIIAHAKSAKADYSRAQTNEQDTLSGYELMLAQETGNAWKQEQTKVMKGDTALNVGDIITNFTAGREIWKVLGAENGKLLLTTTGYIASKAISGDDAVLGVWDEATSSYKNAEDELNKICVENIKLDNLTDEIKSKVTEIRSIKVEDIDRVTGYNPTAKRDGKPYGAENVYQYGNKVTYSMNANEKVAYSSAIKSSDETSETQFLLPNTSDNITSPYTVTSTYYAYIAKYNTGLNVNSNAYKLLFLDNDQVYWLASSYVQAKEGCTCFGLLFVADGCVNKRNSFPYIDIDTGKALPRLENGNLWVTSSGSINKNGGYGNGGVRPVVSLASDIKLTPTGNSGEWNITE